MPIPRHKVPIPLLIRGKEVKHHRRARIWLSLWWSLVCKRCVRVSASQQNCCICECSRILRWRQPARISCICFCVYMELDSICWTCLCDVGSWYVGNLCLGVEDPRPTKSRSRAFRGAFLPYQRYETRGSTMVRALNTCYFLQWLYFYKKKYFQYAEMQRIWFGAEHYSCAVLCRFMQKHAFFA